GAHNEEMHRWLRPLLHPDAPARRTAAATYRAGQFVVTSSLRPLRSGSRRFPEVPTRLTTPAVASLAYLDELATVTFPRVPSPGARALFTEPEGPRATARAAMAARGWDKDPSTSHDAPPPPDRVVTEKRPVNTIRYDPIRYDSEFPPPHGMPELDGWDGLDAN